MLKSEVAGMRGYPSSGPPAKNELRKVSVSKVGDKVFSGVAGLAGGLILAILVGVVIFLVVQAAPTFVADPSLIKGGNGFFAYILPLALGTLVAALIALAIATPVGIGVALFISHYAARKVVRTLGYIIDLLAAIPSVVYGIWGAVFLAPYLRPAYDWLARYFGWTGVFAGPASTTGRTILTASIILAIMILPIIASLSREIFLQTPKLQEEAALALGATKWEVIRMAVLPFGLPGMVSAVMLGLGRALGETMAVAMVLSPGAVVLSLIKAGNQTIAANIALDFPEASGLEINTLIASGLVLFGITLIVNISARWVIGRHKKFVAGV